MKKKIIDNNSELIEKAVGILMDKLGPIETNRFLSLHQAGRIDSVKRHKIWQEQLNKEDFFKEIFS